MFEIIEYEEKFEEKFMHLIEEEGEDWSIYWKEPHATVCRKTFEKSITYLIFGLS